MLHFLGTNGLEGLLYFNMIQSKYDDIVYTWKLSFVSDIPGLISQVLSSKNLPNICLQCVYDKA